MRSGILQRWPSEHPTSSPAGTRRLPGAACDNARAAPGCRGRPRSPLAATAGLLGLGLLLPLLREPRAWPADIGAAGLSLAVRGDPGPPRFAGHGARSDPRAYLGGRALRGLVHHGRASLPKPFCGRSPPTLQRFARLSPEPALRPGPIAEVTRRFSNSAGDADLSRPLHLVRSARLAAWLQRSSCFLGCRRDDRDWPGLEPPINHGPGPLDARTAGLPDL